MGGIKMASCNFIVEYKVHQITHWGICKMQTVGDVSVLFVFGFAVYSKVGSLHCLMGLVWGK
tara:strand:+ start:11944 stop:12129 length:186 start_codon:yes stop_codon:yes gene_type:complete